MTHSWTSRQGFVWLTAVAAVLGFGVFALTRGVWNTLTTHGWRNDQGFVVLLLVCDLVVLALGVWVLRFMWPATIVTNDEGVLISKPWRDRFIAWGDIESVSYHRGDSAGGPALTIKPSPAYFATAGKNKPGAMPLDWSISGLGFSQDELEDMEAVFRSYGHGWHGGYPAHDHANGSLERE